MNFVSRKTEWETPDLSDLCSLLLFHLEPVMWPLVLLHLCSVFSVKTTMQAEPQRASGSQWGMHRHMYVSPWHSHSPLVSADCRNSGWCDASTGDHLWQTQHSVRTTQCERLVKENQKRICVEAELLIVVQRYCPLKSSSPCASNESANTSQLIFLG